MFSGSSVLWSPNVTQRASRMFEPNLNGLNHNAAEQDATGDPMQAWAS